MKKFSILILLLAIFVALMVLVSCNKEEPTDEDCFIFYPLDDGTYAIGCDTELVKYLTKIIIPAKHNGKKVSAIVEYAFYGCYDVETIIIPDGIVNIGKYAFYNCNQLTNIILPNSVKTIEEYAFDTCKNLGSIVIPNSVTSIGNKAFSGCYKLKIHCEAESKPEGWSEQWNSSSRPVKWNYKG